MKFSKFAASTLHPWVFHKFLWRHLVHVVHIRAEKPSENISLVYMNIYNCIYLFMYILFGFYLLNSHDFNFGFVRLRKLRLSKYDTMVIFVKFCRTQNITLWIRKTIENEMRRNKQKTEIRPNQQF